MHRGVNNAATLSVSEQRKRFQRQLDAAAAAADSRPHVITGSSRDASRLSSSPEAGHANNGTHRTSGSSSSSSAKDAIVISSSRRPGLRRPPLPPSISIRVPDSSEVDSARAAGGDETADAHGGSGSRPRSSWDSQSPDSGVHCAVDASKTTAASSLKLESPTSVSSRSARSSWDATSDGGGEQSESVQSSPSIHVDDSTTGGGWSGRSRPNWDSPRTSNTLPRGLTLSSSRLRDPDVDPPAVSVRHGSAGQSATAAGPTCSPDDAQVDGGGSVDDVSRKEVREAFLRGEAINQQQTPKFDPSKERERDKEREIMTAAPSARPRAAVTQSSKEVDGYVGFANLPNQVFRKSVKRGFEFTLMVVGESGLGKSTLINSMFLTDLYSNDYPGPSRRARKTVQVEKSQVLLKEGGVQLRLTVVDTPGFGDAVDNSTSWQPIVDYIDKQYEEYLNNESRVNRQVMPDTRVHCCLYFISPNGHGLKALDVEFMKRLHDKVNIVPLIAKADTMTVDECRDFKKTIMNEIAQNHIRIYEFPDCEDEEDSKILRKLKDRVPFAVVGSNTVIDSQGRKVRGRVYPWGVVEVDNLEHNDFIALRNMLVRTHLQDLKDVTNNVHYENFRYGRLSSVTSDAGKGKSSNKSPLLQMEEEKKEHGQKMKKMEADMEQVFETKVLEKRQKLKESEADLQRRAEQMKKSLEQQEKEIQERRAAFEAERQAWEEQQKMFDVDPQSTLRKKKLFNN